MSKIKISENLFLEVNELTRLMKFIEDDGYKKLIKSMIKSVGIVQNESNSNFKVTAKSGSPNTIIINSGIAFDTNLNAIVLKEAIEATINNTGIKKYIILSRSVSNYEEGSVSVNVDGSLTGIGTEFTKVLRGQPNFPTKVKLNSLINSYEYEVVKVISDTSAIISGDFASESNLKYSVIGTFTPGYIPTEYNKFIYEYDSCNISVVDSETIPVLSPDQFILASITFDLNSIMTVTDERVNYMFNNPNVQGIESNVTNPLVSLLSATTIGGIDSINTVSADFELIIEHGYKINSHELIVTSTTNIFQITSGSCNFLGTGNIPDNLFKGWLLVNRNNMKKAKIDNNINKALYISELDSSLIENVNDFIVVPDFSEIEYEVKVSNNVDKKEIAFYFKNSIVNLHTRLRFYTFFANISQTFENIISVSIKKRMLSFSPLDKMYPFDNLSIAAFKNIKGQSEILANSSFNINLSEIQPIPEQNNYS